MTELIPFADLPLGDYIKVSGIHRNGAGFLAVEAVLHPDVQTIKLESLIQQVDLQRKTLRILDQELPLDSIREVQDLANENADLSDLKPGMMVKIKGDYSSSRGFRPERIKIKETLEFNVEELEGRIQAIDKEQKVIVVNGVKISFTDKSIILNAEI